MKSLAKCRLKSGYKVIFLLKSYWKFCCVQFICVNNIRIAFNKSSWAVLNYQSRFIRYSNYFIRMDFSITMFLDNKLSFWGLYAAGQIIWSTIKNYICVDMLCEKYTWKSRLDANLATTCYFLKTLKKNISYVPMYES